MQKTTEADLSAQTTTGAGAPKPDAPGGSKRRFDLPTLLPVVATLTLLLVAVCLRVYTATSLGNLWRDEWSSIDVATQPTWAALVHRMEWDSYPIAYFVVLRGWITAFGLSLTSLRVLGVVISLLTLGALLRHARALRYRYPIVTLLLVGCCGNAVYWGETNRAWQLGLLTLILFYTGFTRCLEKPTPARIAETTFVGVIAAQTLYYNALLIGVCCAAGVLDCLLRKRVRVIPALLVTGIVPALSYLPYQDHFRRVGEWNMMLKRADVDFGWIGAHLLETTGTPMPAMTLLYCAAFAATLGVGMLGGGNRRRTPPTDASDASEGLFLRDDFRFHVLCALIAVPLYVVFLVRLRYPTEPWYYLSLMTFVALAAESTLMPVLLGTLARLRALPIVAGVAALAGLGSLGPLLPFCSRQVTTLDTTARMLSMTARPFDLVLLNQWEAGITFERFYHGSAPWLTIPPVAEHHGHRWDLLKARMLDPNGAWPPVKTALDRCIAQQGTVYMVGINSWGTNIPDVPIPSPPPLPDTGWDPSPYAYAWKIQAARYLRDHGYVDSGRSIPAAPGATTGFEDDAVDTFVPAGSGGGAGAPGG